MTARHDASLSAMMGGGFYNKNAALQAAGITMVLPIWEQACGGIVCGDDETIVIADYGCSQGRNSLIPMHIAIDAVRTKAGQGRPIQILHTDLPSNDFSSLFGVLADDPDSYMHQGLGIFPMVIGRSYFEQIVPDSSVHLIWNTWTMHWMSRAPMNARDAIGPRFSKDPAVGTSTEALQDEDWRRFLELRGRELRPGGKLLTCFTGMEEDRGSGWQEVMEDLWQSVLDLERDGSLSSEEVVRITIPVSPRSRKQIKSPFSDENRFGPLSIEWFDMLYTLDPLWPDYEATKDARKLGEARANGVRAWAAPAIRKLIDPGHDRDALVDRIFSRLTDRMIAKPSKLEVNLACVLLQKDA